MVFTAGGFLEVAIYVCVCVYIYIYTHTHTYIYSKLFIGDKVFKAFMFRTILIIKKKKKAYQYK